MKINDSEIKPDFADIMNPKSKVGKFYKDTEINRLDSYIFYCYNSGVDESKRKVRRSATISKYSSKQYKVDG